MAGFFGVRDGGTYRGAIQSAGDVIVLLTPELAGLPYVISGLVAAGALAAALSTAAQKPADILFLVSAAFSLAAASFFPALSLGIFWKRTTCIAASLGMAAGLGMTCYYMLVNQPWLRSTFGITLPVQLWWGIDPISAGVFGVPAGFAVIILVSFVTPRPDKKSHDLVDYIRYPDPDSL